MIQLLRQDQTRRATVTDCTFSRIEFPRCCRRRVAADFAGGEISSNGGAVLLATAKRRLGLLAGLARRLVDRRQASKVDHKLQRCCASASSQ